MASIRIGNCKIHGTDEQMLNFQAGIDEARDKGRGWLTMEPRYEHDKTRIVAIGAGIPVTITLDGKYTPVGRDIKIVSS